MTCPELTLERAFDTPASTGSDFERALRTRLWRRCRTLFLTGVGVGLAAAVAERLLPTSDPELMSVLVRAKWACGGLGHATAFLVGLTALHAIRDRQSWVHALALVTISLNIALAIYDQVAFAPTADPFFAVSLLLFLSAAFIPWRARFQSILGMVAVICFIAIQLGLYMVLPEARSFWTENGGITELRNDTLWASTGLGVLGGASIFVSRALYSLQKTAHRARRLGNYLVLDEIASGGMGRVLIAQHALLLRPTALKIITPSDPEDCRALARFEREVRLSATLTHPNTITIYDVGWTPDNSLFYAMEYLEGFDLQRLVERFGPLPAARVVHLLRQVCGSLAEAHMRGIVHRDIKPSNIFVTQRGGIHDFVKVLDFGLAKRVTSSGDPELTDSGSLFGTPAYVAPEAVFGAGKLDGRADLYCLGAVAFWLLTGYPPFRTTSTVGLLIDHLRTDPAPPSQLAELPVPPELDALVLKCMQKKPEDRHQTASDLETALDALVLTHRWTNRDAAEWWALHSAKLGDGRDQRGTTDEPAAIRPTYRPKLPIGPLPATNPDPGMGAAIVLR